MTLNFIISLYLQKNVWEKKSIICWKVQGKYGSTNLCAWVWPRIQSLKNHPAANLATYHIYLNHYQGHMEDPSKRLWLISPSIAPINNLTVIYSWSLAGGGLCFRDISDSLDDTESAGGYQRFVSCIKLIVAKSGKHRMTTLKLLDMSETWSSWFSLTSLHKVREISETNDKLRVSRMLCNCLVFI